MWSPEPPCKIKRDSALHQTLATPEPIKTDLPLLSVGHPALPWSSPLLPFPFSPSSADGPHRDICMFFLSSAPVVHDLSWPSWGPHLFRDPPWTLSSDIITSMPYIDLFDYSVSCPARFQGPPGQGLCLLLAVSQGPEQSQLRDRCYVNGHADCRGSSRA